MSALLLHEFHVARGASFRSLNGFEAVGVYRSTEAEYQALTRTAALLDLSFRGRACLLGPDRGKFLHGQVTNDILRLKPGQGCYAALVTAKAKLESDLFIYQLPDEILLDLEPGLTARVIERLNRYIIAEDVQLIDVAPHYGLLTVIGPAAGELVQHGSLGLRLPDQPLTWTSSPRDAGEIYVVNRPRYQLPAYDLFIPVSLLPALAAALDNIAPSLNAAWAGFDALEIARIESAVPRFGVDMTENSLPQEAELQQNAISFSKGCYIGQEVIARIRTYGQVAKSLRFLRLAAGSPPPPSGTPIFVDGKNVGTLTSSVFSPKYGSTVALAYVRKEHFALGTRLQVGSPPLAAEIIALPASP